MITFNNFETKPNVANDEKTDAATQDFTAILNGFSAVLPSRESLPPDVETNASSILGNSVSKSSNEIEQAELVFAPNADSSPAAKEETSVFAEEINNIEDHSNQNFELLQDDFSNVQAASLSKEFSNIQINQPSRSNEINELNFPNQMPETNEMNKQNSPHQAANLIQLNDQNAPSDLKFFVNEENILDLPENFSPEKSPDISKEKSIFDFIKSGDENVEILSVKTSDQPNFAQSELKDFFQKFRSQPSLENQNHATNSNKTVKSPVNFSEVSIDKFSNLISSETENFQNNLTPQIINPASNFFRESVQIEKNLQTETPLSISPNPPTSTEIDLTVADRPIPKPDKSLKTFDDFAGLNFDKFLNTVSKDREIIEVAPNSVVEDKTVFKQLEPKIIELATSLETTGEKQLLKMRLNPAELGEVEIRLEKNSSGKIYAHIRTENEAARHVLVESLGELRSSLQNSGWQIEKLEVSCNPFSSGGNERGEDQSRQTETRETERSKPFGLSAPLENEGETRENPAQRLISLRA